MGTAGPDVVSALGGTDTVNGKAGHDVLCGDGGNDFVAGGDGNDVILGGDGGDVIDGDAGNDVLYAGEGLNAVAGGSGGDTVYALNGSVDAIACGSGTDTVSADFFDVVKKKECEHVTRRLFNRAPTGLILAGSSVAENEPASTVVGTFNATDPDANDTRTYSLVPGDGDADNASFTVAGSQLRTADSFDFESKSSYSIRARITDTAGETFDKSFTITVTDVNEAPSDISLSGSTIAENADSGTTVGTLSGTDPDAGDTTTFSLVVGEADNAQFTIDGTTLKSGAVFDYETKASYDVQVRATDNGGKTFDKTFTVSVTDVEETPPNVDPTAVEDTATVNRYAGETSIDVLGNDTVPSGGSKSIEAVTQPAHGTVAITGGGTGLTYDPQDEYCNSDASADLDPDTFTYTLNGGSQTTVKVKVVAPNDAPTIDPTYNVGSTIWTLVKENRQDATVNVVDNTHRTTFNSNAKDPAACGSGSLSYEWGVSYDTTYIRVVGISGYNSASLVTKSFSIVTGGLPGTTFEINVTSSVSGRHTYLHWQSVVVGGPSLEHYFICRDTPASCQYPNLLPL